MTEKPIFTINEVVKSSSAPAQPEAGELNQERTTPYADNTRDSIKTKAQDGGLLRGVEDAGIMLAAEVEAKSYHPVILFGTQKSGKTSLLLSLLAAIKMEPELSTGLFLGEPILDINTEYGKYLLEKSEEFFGRKSQNFIEGLPAEATDIAEPFLVPITFRPENKPEVKFAFLESNGEWYSPDRNSPKLFVNLKKNIEDFIALYQGAITFIHLIPYTQNAVYSTSDNVINDAEKMANASIAISGALQAYDKIRINKELDRHIMLVTKWDAHSKAGYSRRDILADVDDDVELFAKEKYAQAYTTYRGIGLRDNQRYLDKYCSGLMTEKGILLLKPDNDLKDVVIEYPIKLWRWLYQGGLGVANDFAVDPFPAPPPRGWWPPKWLEDFLNRYF